MKTLPSKEDLLNFRRMYQEDRQKRIKDKIEVLSSKIKWSAQSGKFQHREEVDYDIREAVIDNLTILNTENIYSFQLIFDNKDKAILIIDWKIY